MTNATNTQAQAIELDPKHGDLFGQIIFGQAKATLGGETGKVLAEAYASRTTMDKVSYYTNDAVDAVKEASQATYDAAKEAATAAKEGVVKGYETVKGWFSSDKKADEKTEPAQGQAAENIARFNKIFDSIENTLEYNPAWANGTGYFNHVITDKALQTKLAINELGKSVDPNGRRMIIQLTGLGLFVVFAREAGDNTSYRCHVDDDILEEVDGLRDEISSVVTKKGFDILFGEDNNNTLGQRLSSK
jgi:hypothetical protein